MKSRGTLLFLLFFAIVKAVPTDGDEFADGSIEEMYVLGNEPPYSAIVFMKENEDSTSKSNEEDNTEMILPDDIINGYEIGSVEFGNSVEFQNAVNDDMHENPRGVLRKKPWKGCLKKASKVCLKACKSAYKNACSYRDCQKKLKKALKKECKRECKSYFVGD